MTTIPWRDVADTDGGFIYIALAGKNDAVDGGYWGSWNVSRSPGPLGETCLLYTSDAADE